LREATLPELEKNFLAAKEEFISSFSEVLEFGLSLSGATKARVCALFFAHKHFKEADKLLKQLSPSEVVNMIKLLDAPRKMNATKAKLQLLESRAEQTKKADLKPNQSVQRVKAKTRKKIKFQISMLERECLSTGGVTNAIAKRIRRYCQAIPDHKLVFFLLNFPTEPWAQLADVVHLRPSDFALDYFLAACHGQGELPPSSLVATARDCAAADLPRLLEAHPALRRCYSYLRKRFEGALPPAARLAVAQLAPLEDVLWFFEELHTGAGGEGVERAVAARLAAGEPIAASGRERSSYGKLMERLLTFRKLGLADITSHIEAYADRRMAGIRLAGADKARVAVLGDCSASMEVAIETSSILGSLLSACLRAELVFFNDRLVFPSVAPAGARDVVAVTREVRAERCTSPARALYKYYKMKQPVDLFVVVSDEEENTPCEGMMFADLFAKYRAEVHPRAQVFLASFLEGPPGFLGKLRAALRAKGVGCRQFKFDRRRPDLSKLPHLLGMLALEVGAAAAAAGGGGEGGGEAATGGGPWALMGEGEEKEEKEGKSSPAADDENGNKSNLPSLAEATAPAASHQRPGKREALPSSEKLPKEAGAEETLPTHTPGDAVGLPPSVPQDPPALPPIPPEGAKEEEEEDLPA